MKLYTRQGDDGTTGLIGGKRVPKDDIRVTAYGAIDETNAAIGLAISACRDETIITRLQRIQSDLFVVGAELATREGQTPKQAISQAHVTQLEHWIDEASAEVSPLRNFVLPGGNETSARLHLARTICRRAERSVVELGRAQKVSESALAYLNRLSDLLFALARLANHKAGITDVPWPPRET